jgi:hypothetical protein
MLKELQRQLGEVEKDLRPFLAHVSGLEKKRDAIKVAIEAAEGVAAAVAKHEKPPTKKVEPKPEIKPATPAKK